MKANGKKDEPIFLHDICERIIIHFNFHPLIFLTQLAMRGSGAATVTASTPPGVAVTANSTPQPSNGLSRQPFQASDLNLNDVSKSINMHHFVTVEQLKVFFCTWPGQL